MAAYAIQFRRGTTTQHSSFTGLLGEVTVDTDKKTLVVHDGSTTGGFPLMREGAASTSSTGSFTSNVSVGGTMTVTSTSTFNDDVSIVGDLGMTGHILPAANVTYDLGSSTMMWRDIYVGPGSLYVNGKKVIDDDSGTINISTDANQALKVATSGTGTLQLESANGIQVIGELNAASGDIQVGDHIDMNSNLIKEVATPVSGTDAANKNYVDSAASTAMSSGSNAVSGTTGAFSSNVTISGDLTVSGTTTTVNSTTIELADNILLLNSNATGSASSNAGLEVERGDDLNVQFLWDEGNDRWSLGSEDIYTSGSFIGQISDISNHDTDSLSEGSTNQYFTNARAISALSGTDTDALSEGSSNLYFTDARAVAALSGADTDDIAEGSRQYFTTARVRSSISATGDISYNQSTGAFSFTERTDAEVRGLVSATGDLSYNSSTGAFSFTERTDAEVRGLVSAAGDLSYNSSTGAFSFTERTDAEVRGLVSATGDLSYNSSTGVFSFTETPEDYVSSASFATGTGVLTLSRVQGGSVTVDLDGRYLLAADNNDTHLDSLSWDTSNGILTATMNDSSTKTVDLDGRYITSETHLDSMSFNTSTGVLTGTMSDSSTVTVDLDGRYAQLTATTKKMTHGYAVTATDASNNAGSSASLTWATLNTTAQKIDFGSDAIAFASEINDSPFAQVYLNRMLLRPNEVSITSTGLTFAADTISTDDEIEVVYMDEQ